MLPRTFHLNCSFGDKKITIKNIHPKFTDKTRNNHLMDNARLSLHCVTENGKEKEVVVMGLETQLLSSRCNNQKLLPHYFIVSSGM